MKKITNYLKTPLRSWAKSLSVGALLLCSINFNAQPGAALNFVGTSSTNINLGAPLTNSLSTLNKITVEAWVRPTSTLGLGCVIGNYNTGGSSGLQFLLRRSGGSNYEFFIGNGNGGNFQQVNSVAAPTINVWHHVAGVWDGTVASIYVNGVFSASTTITYAAMGTFTNPVWIGRNGIGENFTGDIDEVRIWNRVVCAAELSNNRLAELPLPQFGLLGYYKLNHGTAGGNNAGVTNAIDYSPANNTGTLTNFALTGGTSNWITPGGVTSGSLVPTFGNITVNSGTINPGQTFTMVPSGGVSYTFSSGSATVSPLVQTNYGVYTSTNGCIHTAISTVSVNGSYLDFDPVDDFVTMGTAINGSLATSNKLTVEAWAKPSNFSPALGCIVGNYSTTVGNSMQFLIRRGTTNWQFFVGNSTNGGYTALNSVSAPTLNVWQHVAGVWNGTVMSIYINGVFSSSTTCTYSNMGVQTNQLWLGANGVGGTENYRGGIDEVRIWNRALCASEIANNMNGELSLPQNSLVAYYKLNQGFSGVANPTATLAIDAGPGNVTGTLTNMALTGTVSNWASPSTLTIGSNAPTFTVAGFSVAGASGICTGASATFTASGANTYSWSTGPTTTTITVSPTLTSNYSVLGTFTNGCIATVIKSVTVNPLPTVSVNSGSICSGSSFTINPSGASTYTIEGGNAVVSPTTNTTYTVVGTSSAGCLSSNTATAAITVSICSTGLNDQAGILSGSQLYPNPATGSVIIDLPVQANVTVTDVMGKVVLNEEVMAGKKAFDLSNFNTGVYFVKVSKDYSHITYKLVVQ